MDGSIHKVKDNYFVIFLAIIGVFLIVCGLGIMVTLFNEETIINNMEIEKFSFYVPTTFTSKDKFYVSPKEECAVAGATLKTDEFSTETYLKSVYPIKDFVDREIMGITWKYANIYNDNIDSSFYYTVYDNKTYLVVTDFKENYSENECLELNNKLLKSFKFED